MPTIWFKIVNPQQAEIRLFSLWCDNHDGAIIYEPLEKKTRDVFKLEDGYKFHYTLKDSCGDEVTIKKDYELLHYINTEKNTPLKLTMVPELTNTYPEEDKNSCHLTEALQSISKKLELSLNNLQAKAEKSAACNLEAAVTTAAETAAHLFRSLLPVSPMPRKPDIDIICDGCYSPIQGERYCCETCEDYDLCSSCKCFVNHNPAHNFRRIMKEPLNVPKAKITSRNAERSHFICDYCDTDIVGIIHSCSVCPDFDLCHPCFSIVKENHPKQHIFITHLVVGQMFDNLAQSAKNEQDSAPDYTETCSSSSENSISTKVRHLGVECDHCNSPIDGIRYKCGHCPNFDLCATCEEHALSIHDREHAFIKIRFPIQSVSKSPLLPRFKTLNMQRCSKPQNPSLAKEMISTPNLGNFPYEVISKPEEIVNPRSSGSSSTFLSADPSVAPQPSLPIAKPEPEPKISASFISDLNIPDGTLIVPKKTFIKMWKIKNTGNVDWPAGSHLLFNGGSILRPYPMSRPDCFAVPVVSPDEEACITAELQAPDCPGEYTSYFCLCTPDGDRFGDNLWCSIKVDEDLEPEKNKEENFVTSSPASPATVMVESTTNRIRFGDNLWCAVKVYGELEPEKNNEGNSVASSPVSAAPVMVNSSTSMIYPTISIAPSRNNSREQQQLENPFETDYYSETATGDHASITTSHTTYTYTNSQVSSPSPSEVDIGERIDNTLYVDDEQSHHSNERSDNKNTAHSSYEVISPATSIVVEKSVSNIEDDDGFVVVSDDERYSSEYTKAEQSPNSSSFHSTQTVTENGLHKSMHSNSDIYQAQLLQLHEMGFISHDDLAISLLKLHNGQLDVVIAKLVEYP